MSGVREFRREDVAEVTDLWLKVFRRRQGPATESLRDYFKQVFFDNPWADCGLPSLVYEQDGEGVAGFLGVIPRRMTLENRPVKVAVATQFMVSRGSHAPYAAIQLIQRFFAGGQDLSLSDGANDAARKLWLAAGGQAALLYSLNWIRILRPAQYFSALLKRSPRFAFIAAALWPISRAVDGFAARSTLGSYWAADCSNLLVQESPGADTLLWSMRHLSGKSPLQPDYDIDCLRWLLQRAGEKKHFGALKTAIVREASGSIAGWFLYYIRPGEVAQVLHFGGRPKAIPRVLRQLFHHARNNGAVAVCGELLPCYAGDLAQARCQFISPGYSVLVQSGTPYLLNSVLNGNALLTRLDGEWWARFSDPEWSMHGVPPGAAAPDSAGPLKAPRFETAH